MSCFLCCSGGTSIQIGRGEGENRGGGGEACLAGDRSEEGEADCSLLFLARGSRHRSPPDGEQRSHREDPAPPLIFDCLSREILKAARDRVI